MGHNKGKDVIKGKETSKYNQKTWKAGDKGRKKEKMHYNEKKQGEEGRQEGLMESGEVHVALAVCAYMLEVWGCGGGGWEGQRVPLFGQRIT